MNIFLAGATGAVGQSLITQLIRQGHTVVGITRSASRAPLLKALGAEPVVLDALDRDAVLAAVAAAQPDAIVSQLTALAGLTDMRRFERAFALTNRLRTEGTSHLLEAARVNGVERVVVQSFTGWPNLRGGDPSVLRDERVPLDPDLPQQLRATRDAIVEQEQLVTAAGGVALRYGALYGPGTGIVPGGDQWETVRARKFPLVGDSGGVWSFVHVDDAASATVAALERWTPGEVYNVCDDRPAPVREWLPVLATAAGAKPPRHVPRWVGGLLGAHLVTLMCEIRGSSNAKAKRRLGWEPAWPSWRDGFAALAATDRPAPASAAAHASAR